MSKKDENRYQFSDFRLDCYLIVMQPIYFIIDLITRPENRSRILARQERERNLIYGDRKVVDYKPEEIPKFGSFAEDYPDLHIPTPL